MQSAGMYQHVCNYDCVYIGCPWDSVPESEPEPIEDNIIAPPPKKRKRKLFWKIRLATKWLALKLHLTVIEYCDDCGKKQPLIWIASDSLWKEVTDRESHFTDGGGVYCPDCFDRKAREKNLMIRWVPMVEYRGHELVESHEQYMKILTGEDLLVKNFWD